MNTNSVNTDNMNTDPGNISIGSIKRQARERLLGHWSEHTSYSILLLLLEILCGMPGSMFTQNTLMSAVFALGISSILQLLMGLFYAGAKLHFLRSSNLILKEVAHQIYTFCSRCFIEPPAIKFNHHIKRLKFILKIQFKLNRSFIKLYRNFKTFCIF